MFQTLSGNLRRIMLSTFCDSFWVWMSLTDINHRPFKRSYKLVVFLFLKMKLKLKVQPRIQVESQKMLNTIRDEDFQRAFEAWRKWWDYCINTEGKCFKGVEVKFKLDKYSIFINLVWFPFDSSIYWRAHFYFTLLCSYFVIQNFISNDNYFCKRFKKFK